MEKMSGGIKSKLLLGICLGLILFIFSRIEIRYRIIETFINEKVTSERLREEQKKLEAEAQLTKEKTEADRVAAERADAERKALEAMKESEIAEANRIAAIEKTEAEQREAEQQREAELLAEKKEADRIAALKVDADKKALRDKIEAEKRVANSRIKWQNQPSEFDRLHPQTAPKTIPQVNPIQAITPVERKSENSYSIQNISNTLTGNYTFNQNTRILGVITGQCTVAENVYFEIVGIVTGNVTLNRNATLKVNGILTGNVYNYGGQVIENNKINGQVYNY